MSEYQYYEFQAIDRPLSEDEQAYIRTLSRRVMPTSRQAVFTYSFGDFHADPIKVLEKCFDAMLYLANWGTRRLMFRLPRALVNAEALAPYCFPDSISTSVTKNHVIVDMCINEETGGEWIEGEGWLSSLIPLRQDVLRGDLRVLYLAWLRAAMLEGELEEFENVLEPPVPANLRKLSAPLKKFVELFEVDKNLIAVASEASAEKDDAFERELETWVARLSEKERNEFLIRLARGESHVEAELVKRLRELSLGGKSADQPSAAACRRTISELLAAAREVTKRRRERERQEAEKARIHKLEEMAPKQPEMWDQVRALIEKKQTSAYDEAVTILRQLRDLAEHLGQLERFASRVQQLAEDYRNRPALRERLERAGLTKGAK
jgi:hypothetical protein